MATRPNSAASPSTAPPAPLQQIVISKSDLDDPSLTLLNNVLTNYQQVLNRLQGFSGPIRFNDDIDMAGGRISNVGGAVNAGDVVSQAFANSKYSADALRPHLEALGKSIMQTYRQLSNPNQREKYSSFLNRVLSTAPTSNTSIVSATPASGGTVNVTISGGNHLRVDGSVVPYAARTDTLSLPTSWAISSLVRSGGVVTATTSVTNTLNVGEGFAVVSPTDPTFAGLFSVSTIVTPGSVFTYTQDGPNATSTAGGSISLGSVYYYYIRHGMDTLSLIGGFSSDTWENRIQASYDGSTIVGVVTLNSSGLDTVNSAAGATAPVVSALPVVRRL